MEVLHQWINENSNLNRIRQSSAMNLSAPMMVARRDGPDRIVINYKTTLNAITKPQRYDPPSILDSLQNAARYRVFAKIDIKDAFHHLQIVEEHRYLTAFSTPWGSYEYNCMPQGWCNSPAFWQRFIANLLRDEWHVNCTAYMDDILIYAMGFAECHALFRRIKNKLTRKGLTINDKKTIGPCSSVRFLGCNVAYDAVIPRIDTRTIDTWPVPRNKLQLQRWLGTVNSYRPFIPNLSALVRQQEKALGKNWLWEADQNQSFEKTKQALKRCHRLGSTPVQHMILTTDASLLGISGILRTDTTAVAIVSRKTSPAETNYDTLERELLAIVWTLDECAHLISDATRLTVYTDHQNIVSSLRPSNNKRRNRWLEKLSQHNISWRFIPGKNNPADGPSRLWDES